MSNIKPVDERSTDGRNITRTLWIKSSSTRVELLGFRRPVASGQEKLQGVGEDTDRDLREDKDMSKAADSMRRGLEQAVAYAKGEADRNT